MAGSSRHPDGKTKAGLSITNSIPGHLEGADFQGLLESMPAACLLVIDDRFAYVNAAAVELLGAESPDDIVGKPALNLIRPEDRQWASDRLSSGSQGRRLPAQERSICAFDGSQLDVEVDMTLIDLDGRAGMLASVREITLRKQLRSAYRNLVEHSLQGFVIIQHGRVIFANQAITRIADQPLENILGMTIDDLIAMLHPEDRPIAAANCRRRTGDSPPLPSGVYRLLRRDGQLRHLECHVSVTEYLGEEALQMAVTDVTERVHAEGALRESEARFRTIFEQSTIGIYRTTPSGEIIMANPAMVRMLGYETFEELARRSLSRDGYEPEYPRSGFINRMERAGRVDGMEAAWKKRDGTTIYVRESARAVRDENGCIRYFDGTVEEVTRRRLAEQKLQAERRRLLSIFDGLDAVIYVCDPDTHEILYFNQAGIEQWGEPGGRKCFEVLQGRSDPCPYCTNDRIFAAEYEGRSYIWEHLNESNRRWYRCADKAITWPDGRTVRFEMAYDITNERRLTEEIARTEKLESVGILAGGIAHDFNNLLTGVLGNITLALTDVGDNAGIIDCLKQAEAAALRARSLTQRLLTFSRGGAPVTAVTSIQSLLKECSEFVLAGSTARCRFDLPDNLSLVEVDEGQLSQVIANLILNADQAMPEGGEVLVSARNVGIKGDSRLPLHKGEYVRISVRDRGVGIPPDDIGRIFDPFFTTKEFGRGLGLATSFAIVRKHRGHLAVESRPGHGSTFHVYLPASSAETELSPPPTANHQGESGNVLVVDDDEVVRNVAEITLTKLGYRVTTAVSGEEAVRALRQAKDHGRPFDLVVLDLTMPGGIDGVETLKRMREIEPCQCAVVSSGYVNSSVMSNYRDHGFSGAVEKPYTFTRLAGAVQQALKEAASSE